MTRTSARVPTPAHSTHTAHAVPATNSSAPSTSPIVETMRARTRALCDILERETRALSCGDVPSFLAQQDAKQEQARAWHSAYLDLSTARGGEAAAPFGSDIRAQLEALHATFSETVARNRAALERSARSFQRLGERIVTHVRRAAVEKSTIGYSEAGTMRNAASRTLSMGVSESA